MNFKKTVLDNGLRIITAPQPDNPAVTILVLVEAGSEYETKEINGLSHFLEHLCFKGTKKRPKAIDIAGELDGIGALYNAFTSQEFTGYFAKAEAKHFGKILDVVSDIYLNSVFDPKEIDKERGVIIEEINMYEDLPMARVHYLFLELLYGDQPAGWNIVGEKEIIRALKREDFIAYRKKHYLAGKTIVIVAGNVKEDEAIAKVENIFTDIPTGTEVKKAKPKETQEKPELLVKFKESDQTHLILGVRGYDIFDKRRFTVDVISDILGGGMSSRLFQKIREEMGAAYYVGAGSEFFSDHGYLRASAGIDRQRLQEVIEAITAEFKRLKEEPISQTELQRVKDHLIGSLMLGLETSDDLARFYGGQEVIERKIMMPEEIARQIQAVTVEEIQEVAEDLFRDERLNLAVIGPIQNGDQLRPALKID
ncbi:MAG: pitrilysin family protein [Candidatus Colwellbacteria bacterium]|nr:pitrilysin family protein [Candidatus Colwellbacteria bacterium]